MVIPPVAALLGWNSKPRWRTCNDVKVSGHAALLELLERGLKDRCHTKYPASRFQNRIVHRQLVEYEYRFTE